MKSKQKKHLYNINSKNNWNRNVVKRNQKIYQNSSPVICGPWWRPFLNHHPQLEHWGCKVPSSKLRHGKIMKVSPPVTSHVIYYATFPEKPWIFHDLPSILANWKVLIGTSGIPGPGPQIVTPETATPGEKVSGIQVVSQ